MKFVSHCTGEIYSPGKLIIKTFNNNVAVYIGTVKYAVVCEAGKCWDFHLQE
jgi:hypothetical protein